MTRKHIEKIAEIIYSEAVDVTWTPDVIKIMTCQTIAEKLADYFESEFNNFNKEKFIKACGL